MPVRAGFRLDRDLPPPGREREAAGRDETFERLQAPSGGGVTHRHDAAPGKGVEGERRGRPGGNGGRDFFDGAPAEPRGLLRLRGPRRVGDGAGFRPGRGISPEPSLRSAPSRGVDDLLVAPRALLAPLGHHPEDDAGDVVRDRGMPFGATSGGGVRLEVERDVADGRLGVERRVPREDPVEDDPERVDVAPPVEGLALLERPDLLGRPVRGLSHEEARLREVAERLLGRRVLRDAEVEDLRPGGADRPRRRRRRRGRGPGGRPTATRGTPFRRRSGRGVGGSRAWAFPRSR